MNKKIESGKRYRSAEGHWPIYHVSKMAGGGRLWALCEWENGNTSAGVDGDVLQRRFAAGEIEEVEPPADSEVVRLNVEPSLTFTGDLAGTDGVTLEKYAMLERTNAELQCENAEINRKLSEREAELVQSKNNAGEIMAANHRQIGVIQYLRRDLAASQALCAELREVLESFHMTCVESSRYKDCSITFHRPHCAYMRLSNDSRVSFVVADFEKRRLAALAKTPETAGKEVAELREELEQWKKRAQGEADGYGELLQAAGTFNQKEAITLIVSARDLRAEVERLRKTAKTCLELERARAEAAELNQANLQEQLNSYVGRAEAAEARIEELINEHTDLAGRLDMASDRATKAEFYSTILRQVGCPIDGDTDQIAAWRDAAVRKAPHPDSVRLDFIAGTLSRVMVETDDGEATIPPEWTVSGDRIGHGATLRAAIDDCMEGA